MDIIYKEKLFDVLKYFISICNKYNLTYYIAAGSALGAIRHSDIIPWDDDVDVYMPREDYDKLVSLRNYINNESFSLETLDKDGFYTPYAKLTNAKTTLWELKKLPYVIGIFIDIFPLDETSGSEEQIKKTIIAYKTKFDKYLRGIHSYDFMDIWSLIYQMHFKNLIKSILDITYYRWFKNKNLQSFLNFEKSLNNTNKGNYYIVYGGSYGVKEIFKKEWFKKTIEVPFGNISVKIPIGYDEYLTYLYGDYMKLPSKEEQISRHKHYYLNLNKRYNITEIKSMFRK